MENFIFINVLIILIMFLFHIIILACGPYNYKFYQFLNIYLSNITNFEEQTDYFSTDYKSYLAYYKENLEKYKININAAFLHKNNYNNFKQLKILQFVLNMCLFFFNFTFGFYLIILLKKLPGKLSKKILFSIKEIIEIDEIKEVFSDIKCKYSLL